MLRNFFAREELARPVAGQAMVEYALLLGLISVVAVAVLLLFGPQLTAIYKAILDALTTGAEAAG